VDTSGWYAAAAVQDRFHTEGARHLQELLDSSTHLFTSDYVLDETLTRLRYDSSHREALAFWQKIEAARQIGFLTVLWVEEAIWTAALDIFRQYEDQRLSFTDCTSFVLAQTHSIDQVFAFDDHFRMFGLTVRPTFITSAGSGTTWPAYPLRIGYMVPRQNQHGYSFPFLSLKPLSPPCDPGALRETRASAARSAAGEGKSQAAARVTVLSTLLLPSVGRNVMVSV
jgi:predicted nucleic acid-binding protein